MFLPRFRLRILAVSSCVNDWNNKLEMHHIALTAAIVLLALVLQKPSQGSKAKDHEECLSRRLALWKEGEIDTLLREGRMIQKRLTKPRRNDPQNKAKMFAKLVLEGQLIHKTYMQPLLWD